MKKRLLSVALLMGAYGAYGQVGIGTLTPNASSQLDVVSNDKGVLLPRVSLSSTTDSTTISNGNVNSLLVFNTNTENDIKPGYYYWFEDKWMRVMNEDDVTQFDHNTTNSSLTVINGNLVLLDSDGNEVSIPLSEINIPSTLIQNQDGTYTFTNELGETVIIDATDNVINNFENIVNNTNVLNELIEVLGDTYVGGNVNYDGDTFTYIDQTGNTQIVNIQDIVENTIVENIQNLGDIYNEIINLLEQESDTLVNNGDGTYTHTAVDSTSVIIDANTTTVTVTDGVYTFLNGNGDTITTIDTNADAIIYDNTDSELAAENVQDAIDELANLLEEGAGVELQDKGDGKITLVAENGDVLGTVEKAELTEDANNDGLFTFTRNDGEDVVFDVNSVNVAEKTDAAGNVVGYDFLDANGNPITTVYTDASNNYYDNTDSELVAENVQDAIDELANLLEEGAGVELQDKGDGKITLVAENGDVLGTVDKAELTEDANNDGLFTFTRNDGVDVVFDVNSVNVTEKLDAAGNVVGYDFLDANGNPITTVYTDASNNYYDNTDSELVAENVQDAIDELANLLEEGAGVELQDKGDGKITLVAENGDVLGTVDKAELTEDANNDGLFTFTRNDGVDVVFDVNSVNVTEKLDANGNVVGYDFLDANGNPITTVYTDASNNYYDNTDSELVAENVQDAIDELADIIDTNKGDLTSTADNRINITNGTKALLHDAQIDVNEGNLRLQNIGGTLQVSQIQNGTSGQILVTNEGGNGVTWAEPLAIAKGDLTSNDLEVTNGTNSIIKDVSLEIKTGAITTDKIQNKAVTADKLNGGTGVDDRVGVADADGNITYTTLDEAVKNNETVTVLVKNTDGTYTYYNENEIAADGTPLATAPGSKIDNAKGATAADDATLGLVKEATDNPTVAVSQTGELSVNLENVNAIKEVNNDYNAILDDVILLGNANTGDITITLPSAAGNKGKKFTIKKHDTNEDYFVNVVGNINGLTELYTALPHSGWDLVSDGLTWKIVNKF